MRPQVATVVKNEENNQFQFNDVNIMRYWPSSEPETENVAISTNYSCFCCSGRRYDFKYILTFLGTETSLK